MKRKLFICSTFVLLLGLTACTQDGLPADGAEGTPMTFTATGLNFPDARSRATVDGDWEGVNTVAVKIGYETKAYTVTSVSGDNASVTLTSGNPFYWSSTVPVTVSAWPCTDISSPDMPFPDDHFIERMPEVVVQEDQSGDGFAESDFIAAEPQEVSIGDPSLKFTHRTARVTVTLISEDGSSVNGATMNFLGLNTRNGNPASIISHNVAGTNVYEALLAPQTIKKGVIFISVKLGGISYTYTLKDNDIELEAGSRYNYTMRVNAGKLELVGSTITGWTDIPEVEGNVIPSHVVMTDGTYIVYTAEGLYAWANHVNDNNWSANCILENDIVLPAVPEGGSNWTPIGTDGDNPFYGTFDGNNHTITGLILNLPSDGNLGFFGYIGKYGTVKNLILENVEINGGSYAGALAGYNLGNIISCSASGKNQGASDVSSSSVGGLIGSNSGNVTACHFNGTVEGQGNAAGIIGSNEGIVTACYAEGTVTAKYIAGGVTGWTTHKLISCYFDGTVTGDEYSGGVVGYKSDYSSTGSNIINSYWSGNADKGIGGGASGDVTKIGGSATWETATSDMNAALAAENSEWRYVQGDDKALPPTLQKKQ